MDAKRKKELAEAYKTRKPDMGVIFFRCSATGEIFFGASRDTKADLNSTRFKLSAGNHPNGNLQGLWNRYGGEGFESGVYKALEYDDPGKDQGAELEALRELCLEQEPGAGKIWR